ncbi:MAG: hypothetical protein ACI9SP_000364 [Arenicella sp.]|jgi:hypothetical protein
MSENKTKDGDVKKISVEDLLSTIDDDNALVGELQQQFEENFNRTAVKSQFDYAHLKGLQDHYRHKSRWSIFLMVCMGGMIAFQSLLLVGVGFDWLDYSKYKWLLPALMVQNLGQIVGLAVFVVKGLFKDMDSN